MLWQKMLVSFSCLCCKSINIRRSQTALQATLIVAMYIASADDNATVVRFLDNHEIILDPSWNTHPILLFRLSMLPALLPVS